MPKIFLQFHELISATGWFSKSVVDHLPNKERTSYFQLFASGCSYIYIYIYNIWWESSRNDLPQDYFPQEIAPPIGAKKSYVWQMVTKLGLHDCKRISTPQSDSGCSNKKWKIFRSFQTFFYLFISLICI